jgi:CheY-like chemotaxis protein
MAPGRIRVFIAGSIHTNRTVVRRFLEDDGYEVVGEALTPENLAAAIRRSEPDAVVLDDGLLDRGTMARVRRAAPDAKIIVFTDSPTTQASGPIGADGYLEKGLGLAALTSLLGRLLTDEQSLAPPLAAGVAGGGAGRGAGVAAAGSAGVAAAAGTGVADRTPGSGGAPSSRVGGVGRLVTIASGAVLIVWGLIAMIATDGVAPPPAETTDTTRPGTVVASSTLDQAYDALDGLLDALRGGNYVLATIQAQTLMDERRQAIAEGYSLSGLDAAIAVRLDGLVGGLPQRVNTTLGDILRSLYPTLPDEDQPGGGSGVVFGPTTSSSTFTGGNDEGTARQDGDGRDGTGSGGNDGGEGEGGDAGDAVVLRPGDGRAWGQSHKSDHTWNGHGHPGGAPGGGPPPWANGNANGHDKRKHR